MTSTPDSRSPQAAPSPLDILRRYWGYEHFRGIQQEIIQSVLAGHDTLGLMPTGGGKSIAFQVPALALEGVCIVVTPLIALMKDQVAHLRARSITAAAIYSGQSRDEMLRHLDNAVFGAYKFLYVSPERLTTDIFQVKLRKMQVGLLTVDEAHCISQWGYDFRPPYLQIAQIRKLLPGVPVLALTATATTEVVRDICAHLAWPESSPVATGEPPAGGETVEGFQVYKMSFARPNLSYVVRKTTDKFAELLHILRSVPGSAIVYTRNRERTRETSDHLNEEGITALYYHAGLKNVDKDLRSTAWQSGETRVMVATNAFGMGIDKPDVRLVIHLDMPDSIEAYFQEAGRAGRDGQRAYAVLLFAREDRASMLRRVGETYPPREYISRVYENLCCCFQLAVGDGYNVTYELNVEEFCKNFRHFPTYLESALKLLTNAGYINYTEEDEVASRILFLVQRDELYRLHHLGREADNVIRALLRTTCGLFSDYVFLQEATIAHEANLPLDTVYEVLKHLSHLRIVHYVPHKKVPRVTFTTRRVETAEVVLTAEVYEERRQQYVNRTQQMLEYAENDCYCRSRFLLEYFSDFSGRNCGHCDVCLDLGLKEREDETAAPPSAEPSPRSAKLTDETVRAHLRAALADGGLHSVDDVNLSGIPTERMAHLLQQMVEDGEAEVVNGKYRKHS